MTEPLSQISPLDLNRVAALVRPFEAFTPRAVLRPMGGWVIGYGHTQTARAGAVVTREEADALLLYDLDRLAGPVRAAIYAPVTRNQLEALIAFAFNIGLDNFLASSTLRLLNAGDPLAAAQELERWRRADVSGEDQVLDALVRRRAAEKARFLTPPQGFPKASSAVMRPHFDEALALTVEPTSAVSGETPAGSASLAAADNVTQRLRTIVPDVAPVEAASSPPGQVPDPEPIFTEPVFAPTHTELAALAALPVAPLIERGLTTPATEPADHTRVAANDPFAAPPEAMAASHTGVLLEDPFAPPPPFETLGSADKTSQATLSPLSYEAPPFEPLMTGDRAVFGSAAARRAYTAANSATTPSASVHFWRTLGTGLLVLLALLGVALFAYAVWLMLKAEPTALSFGLGVAGVLAMIPAGYVLLGVRTPPGSSR